MKRLGSDPDTGACLDCEVGAHGMIEDGRCVCCGVRVLPIVEEGA